MKTIPNRAKKAAKNNNEFSFRMNIAGMMKVCGNDEKTSKGCQKKTKPVRYNTAKIKITMRLFDFSKEELAFLNPIIWEKDDRRPEAMK